MLTLPLCLIHLYPQSSDSGPKNCNVFFSVFLIIIHVNSCIFLSKGTRSKYCSVNTQCTSVLHGCFFLVQFCSPPMMLLHQELQLPPKSARPSAAEFMRLWRRLPWCTMWLRCTRLMAWLTRLRLSSIMKTRAGSTRPPAQTRYDEQRPRSPSPFPFSYIFLLLFGGHVHIYYRHQHL